MPVVSHASVADACLDCELVAGGSVDALEAVFAMNPQHPDFGAFAARAAATGVASLVLLLTPLRLAALELEQTPEPA